MMLEGWLGPDRVGLRTRLWTSAFTLRVEKHHINKEFKGGMEGLMLYSQIGRCSGNG